MKKIFMFLTAIVGIGSTLFAATIGPCDLFVEGQVLILRPCAAGLYYTIEGPYSNTNGSPVGDQRINDPNWSVGFQIGAGIGIDACNTVGLQYTRFHSTNSARTTVQGQADVDGTPCLWFTRIHPDSSEDVLFNGSASSRVKFCLDTVNLDAEHYFCPCGSFSPYLLVGLGWGELDFNERIVYEGEFEGQAPDRNSTSSTYTSQVWGVGPRIGVGMTYTICGPLQLVAQGHTSFLVGQSKSSSISISTQDPENDFNVCNDSGCGYLTNIGVRLGFEAGCDFNCLSIWGEAGYRYDHYFDGIHQTDWYDNTRDGLNTVVSVPFYLSGFYIGGGISF